MPRIATLAFALVLLALAPRSACAQVVTAQVVTVETIATSTQIDDGLALGPDGALYGSRFGSFPRPVGTTVTRVDLTDGSTSRYAGGFQRANGLSFGPDGSLYVANYNSGRITRVAPGGGSSSVHVQESSGTTLSGSAFDAVGGGLYYTSYDGDWVKHIDAQGTRTTIATRDDGMDGPAGLAFDDQNRLYIANYDDGNIFRVDGGGITLFATVPSSIGFLAYGGGRFFATGIVNNRIYMITPDGAVTKIAGGSQGSQDGDGATARFSRPNGIVATPSGDTLYVSDVGTRNIRRIIFGAPTSVDEAESVRGGLHAPAPNPAAFSTTLRFGLPQPEAIELVLYDALGRRVRVLAAGHRSAGEHTVPVDLSALAPGPYFVTLRRGSSTQTRTLVRL